MKLILVKVSFLFYTLLNVALTYAVEEIKLGVLLPSDSRYSFSIDRVRPAFDRAFQQVQQKEILPNYRLYAIFRNSNCSDTIGLFEAIILHFVEQVHAFLGPVCDYVLAPIARFAPFWSVPVISPGGLIRHFDDTQEFRTLTRIQGSFKQMAVFVQKLLEENDWNSTGILYNQGKAPEQGTNSAHYYMMESVYWILRNRGTEPWRTGFDENHAYTYNMTNILRQAAATSRVLILIASPETIREILITAHELNLDNGDYVFLALDFFHDSSSDRPWYREDDSIDRNEKAKQAYEALLTITQTQPRTEEYKQFVKEVHKRIEEYSNITVDEKVNDFYGYFYDAVLLYALALNESLTQGIQVSDGLNVTKRMWNRTFKGITGTVHIDENGERTLDFSLLDMNPSSNRFEVIANYNGMTKTYVSVPGKQIHFPKSRQSARSEITETS